VSPTLKLLYVKSISVYFELELGNISMGSGTPHFLPSEVVTSFVESRGKKIQDIGVGDVVLLLFPRKVLMDLVKATGAEMSKCWMYGETHPLYNAQIGEWRITLFSPSVGAPATIMQMEELIAYGAQLFIAYGEAGSIQEDLKAGEFVVVTDAIREEGTSFHYLDSEVQVKSNQKLSEILVSACKKNGENPHLGATWTIDAPYRETKDKIARHSKNGVLTVEMEASAIFALGVVRGVKIGTLLTISDEETKPWTAENIRVWSRKNEKAMEKVPRILIDAVDILSKSSI
jgi:uridine phosphorylase